MWLTYNGYAQHIDIQSWSYKHSLHITDVNACYWHQLDLIIIISLQCRHQQDISCTVLRVWWYFLGPPRVHSFKWGCKSARWAPLSEGHTSDSLLMTGAHDLIQLRDSAVETSETSETSETHKTRLRPRLRDFVDYIEMPSRSLESIINFHHHEFSNLGAWGTLSGKVQER